MGKTNYQTANQRLVLLWIFPEPHDSSHRGSRALATRLSSVRFTLDLKPSPHVKRGIVNALPKVVDFLRVLRFPPTGKVGWVG